MASISVASAMYTNHKHSLGPCLLRMSPKMAVAMAHAMDTERGPRPSLPNPAKFQQRLRSPRCNPFSNGEAKEGGQRLLVPHRRIRRYNLHSDDEDEDEEEGCYGWDGEELGLALADNPCWFPIFDGMDSSPTEDELVAAEEAFSRGLAGLAGKIALAELVLLQGRFEEAKSYLESVSRARDLEHSVVAQVRLGMLMENLGRLDEAGFYLKQAALDNAHEGALMFLNVFMHDHGDELDNDVPDESDSWWDAPDGHPLLESPFGFMKDLPKAWFGRLRMGLIYKKKGREWCANKNLFLAHQTHTTHNLLALHLKRAGEVRNRWYKLISLNGEPVHYPPPKPWTDEDDAELLSRVAENDIKGVILGTRKLVCKTPIWMM